MKVHTLPLGFNLRRFEGLKRPPPKLSALVRRGVAGSSVVGRSKNLAREALLGASVRQLSGVFSGLG